MKLLYYNMYSKVLRRNKKFIIIKPKNYKTVLMLLHGQSDDERAWIDKTQVIDYAMTYEVCICMPSAEISYYRDLGPGENYCTYIGEELPNFLSKNLGINFNNQYITGNSMGGHGALNISMRYPQRFSHVAALSPVVYISDSSSINSKKRQMFDKSNNEWNILNQVDKLKKLKSIYLYCGINDFLYNQNVELHQQLITKKIVLETKVDEGDHTWKYWNTELEFILKRWYHEL